MRVNSVVLAVFAVAGVWSVEAGPTTERIYKLCGQQLSEFMSNVCEVFNSPSADDPTVRQKRELGIADLCCGEGCTWTQLIQYCAVPYNSYNSEAPLVDQHSIENRSAETPQTQPTPPGMEVGRRGRRRARCWCRRRAGRRWPQKLMGNMVRVRGVARAAPVVGTVSPQVTWGSLHADLLPDARDRYDHIAIFAAP